MPNSLLIEKFNEFKKKTGKHAGLNIEDIIYDSRPLSAVISDFIKGSTPKYSDQATEVVVIKSGQARGDNNIFNLSKIAYLDASKVSAAKLLTKNDLLINTTGVGTAGRVTLFNLDGKYVSDSHITALRYDTTRYSPIYLLYFFKNFGYKRLESMAEGSGGQIELSMSKVKNIIVPIPIDQNGGYTSIKIQEALVEFLDYQKSQTEFLKDKMSSLQSKVAKTDKAILSKIFEMTDPFIVDQFNKWAELKSYTINANDIKFEVKRIHSDNQAETVCLKRMGFTPTRDPDGDINWFTVADLNAVEGIHIDQPDTKEKTTMTLIRQAVDKKNTGKSEKLNPIQQGDILISFKLTVGVVKIYNSDLPGYCNEAIDILTVKDGFYNEYIAYNCMLEYPKYGTQTNNGMTLNDESKKEINIYVPKPTNGYSSYELQKIIIEFIWAFNSWKNKIMDLSSSVQNKCNKLDDAFLAEIFKGSKND